VPHRSIAGFTDFITRAAARGIVAAEDAELAMSACFSVLVGWWQLWLLTGTHAPPDAAALEAPTDKAIELFKTHHPAALTCGLRCPRKERCADDRAPAHFRRHRKVARNNSATFAPMTSLRQTCRNPALAPVCEHNP